MSKNENFESFKETSENVSGIKEDLLKLKQEIHPFDIHKGVGREGGRIQILRRESNPSFWNKALIRILGPSLFYLKKGRIGLEVSYKGGGMSFETKDKTQYFEITFFVKSKNEKEIGVAKAESYLIKLKLNTDNLDLSSPESVSMQLVNKIIDENEELDDFKGIIKPYIEEFVKELRIYKSSIKLEKEKSDELILHYERGGKEYYLFIRQTGEKSITLTSIILTDYPTSITINDIKDVNDFNIKLGKALDLLLGKLRDKVPDIGADIYNHFFNK